MKRKTYKRTLPRNVSEEVKERSLKAYTEIKKKVKRIGREI